MWKAIAIGTAVIIGVVLIIVAIVNPETREAEEDFAIKVGEVILEDAVEAALI